MSNDVFIAGCGVGPSKKYGEIALAVREVLAQVGDLPREKLRPDDPISDLIDLSGVDALDETCLSEDLLNHPYIPIDQEKLSHITVKEIGHNVTRIRDLVKMIVND